MRIWPFGQSDIERRETRSYADAVLNQLIDQAGGDTVDARQIAALEACLGLWGRAFASADVSPTNVATDALTPNVMQLIGRQLLLRGEAVFEIEVERGLVQLRPASIWSVSGGVDPRDWTYGVTVQGPSETVTRKLQASRVVHVMYGVDPAEPWRGVGPLARINLSKKLAGFIEKRLSEDMSSGVGYVLPVPQLDDGLQADLRELRGKLSLVETTSHGWAAGRDEAPRSDFEPRRLGGNPPEIIDTLRDSVATSIFAACGVHPSLLRITDGTSMREGYRQFLHSTVKPVSRLFISELRDKLNQPALALSHDDLGAGDLTGRARAFQSMVGGGMDVQKAAALAGLMVSDDA